MPKRTIIEAHRITTKKLARELRPNELYHWLVSSGYYPESYVLPPCFKVVKSPAKLKQFYKVKDNKYSPDRTECVNVHFPKSEYTDRTFGIINPKIHNDIAYHISKNWKSIIDALVPSDSIVTSYSFPVPVAYNAPGRVSNLRSGRMIYEFIDMTDDDLVSIAYRYSFLLKADIKNFYPSIYTHSIAWALHGKSYIREHKRFRDYKYLGNRLDKLFQNANDGCTNGLPIGPVVSDVIAEIIAGGVDRHLTKQIKQQQIETAVVRFKDDYRFLVKSESDARILIKALQVSLKEYNLELSDEKTQILDLPKGLFREWVSRYHAIHPQKKETYSWKQFRELYLGVVDIDKICPGTGVIDRFLADITSDKNEFKLQLEERNLERAISMLFLLGSLRIKAFPKIIAILESVIRSPFGKTHEDNILIYVNDYLEKISKEENRNKYLIAWLLYFLVSNGYNRRQRRYKDTITKSIALNRSILFSQENDFILFEDCKSIGNKISMLQYLDVFNPPEAG